jgi:uncharacterized protein
MRIAVLSDTHSPRFWKRCPERVAEHLVGAELILHAGDVCTSDVLDELSEFAPIKVVLGNNDGADVANWGAPVSTDFVLDGVRVAMIHDSGPAKGRMSRMQKRFPEADLIVFGHSHIPWQERAENGVLLFNPGSPTDRRGQPCGTMGLLDLWDGRIDDARIVEVTDRR